MEVILNAWIRRIHRWLALVFTLAAVATTIALSQKEPVVWVSYLPLAPLGLLALTGLYMFIVHYATKWRRRQELQ